MYVHVYFYAYILYKLSEISVSSFQTYKILFVHKIYMNVKYFYKQVINMFAIMMKVDVNNKM